MKVIILGIVVTVLAFMGFTGPDTAPVMQDPEGAEILKGAENSIYYEDNETCFKCHAQEFYTLEDAESGLSQKRVMCQNYIVDRDEYYQSNHWSFACTDCHSWEFSNFPHPTAERLQDHFSCLDCHGYDEAYAQYHFEEIDEEYNASVHAEVEGFSCWECHNPHSYEINVRNSTNLTETILYDNNICLECHGNYDNFRLLSDLDEVDVVVSHEWLPNQVAHFAGVRCIECHTAINDSILVAHHILPKEQAVRNCTECHSSDSRLMATLYKFEAKEQRKRGFLNGVIVNNSYVIGATRNYFLNVASVVIFAGLMLVLAIHVFFRIKKK
jgi:hypothetical protein